MKHYASVRKRCEHCRAVRRKRVLYIVCSVHPKHKQKQYFHTSAGPFLAQATAPSLPSLPAGWASPHICENPSNFASVLCLPQVQSLFYRAFPNVSR